MPTLQYSSQLAGNGSSAGSLKTRTADGGGSREVTLPAGKAGTLTTRTDNDTGVATLSGGHGIVTSDVVDVYWATGRRYGMDATVATNAVTIDGGSGDNLPSTSTAVVVCKQVQINADIDGDELVIAGFCAQVASSTADDRFHVDCQDADDDQIASLDLKSNTLRVYDIEGGDTNVFTGDPITKLMASNGSSTLAATLKVLWLADATP